MGSIARQLLHSLPLESFTKLDQNSYAVSLDTDQIVDSLQKVLPDNRRYFVIIDGLDECEDAEAKKLILATQKLLTSPKITFKLFCSSRPDVFRWVPSLLKPEWHVSMAIGDVNPDIERYIDATLAQRIESGDLQLGNPTLILTIRDTLLNGAQGMFLWVAFQIETLCAQRSDQGLLETLYALPKDLPETFNRILGRLAKMEDIDRNNSLEIFKWVAAAKRPLTLAELREVISIKPCQQVFTMECLINDMSRAMVCCGSLVEIDEEYSTVHFAHHSVKQYLLSVTTDSLLARYHFSLQEADRGAGEICVTYLSFPELTTQVARAPTSRAHVQIYPSTILKESLPQTDLTSRLALKLLKNKRNTDYSFHRHLEESIGIAEVEHPQHAQRQFAFLGYAQTYWLSHTKAFTEHTTTWQLWIDLVRKDLSTAYSPWTNWKSGSYGKYGMEEIVREDHCALLLLRISQSYPSRKFIFKDGHPVGTLELTQVDEVSMFYKMIDQMILEKRYGLLRILLFNSHPQTGPLLTSSLCNDINAALAGLGNLELLEEQQAGIEKLGLAMVYLNDLLGYSIARLLNETLIPEFPGSNGLKIFGPPAYHRWNALAVAAALGHVPVVRFIFAVNRDSGDLGSCTPSFNDIFAQAVIRNQVQVLHVLLDQGGRYLELDKRDLRGFTPLMYIAVLGNVDLARRLISMGAGLDIKNFDGETALSKARDENMKKFLITAAKMTTQNTITSELNPPTTKEA
ncbi:MAG: hypothetical protein Q9187_001148 [Circinaria calcarea]